MTTELQSRDGSNDTLIPELWVSFFLRRLIDLLDEADYKGVLVNSHVASCILKDGELAETRLNLLEEFAGAAAQKIADEILTTETMRKYGNRKTPVTDYQLRLGYVAASAIFDNLRAVVVMQYHSLTSGTEIIFKV